MIKVILNLKEIIQPDDAADALAVAISYAHTGNISTKGGPASGGKSWKH